MAEKREFAGCTICCNVCAVTALGKPSYADCEHQTATGCLIYPNRPKECREFECFWKLGLSAIHPAELGVLFFPCQESTGLHLDLWLLTDDKSKLPAIWEEAERIMDRFPICVSARLIPVGSRVRMPFAVDMVKYPKYNPVARNQYVGKGRRFMFIGRPDDASSFLHDDDPMGDGCTAAHAAVQRPLDPVVDE